MTPVNDSTVFDSLDERERQTLDLILAGYPSKTIQRRLGLARRTVTRIRASILAKTNFLSFVELSAAYGEARAANRKDSRKTATEARCRSPSNAALTGTAEIAEDSSVESETNWRLLCCDLHDGATSQRLKRLAISCAPWATSSGRSSS
jgi:DNA-binding CsgD family transcriptional regulator